MLSRGGTGQSEESGGRRYTSPHTSPRNPDMANLPSPMGDVVSSS